MKDLPIGNLSSRLLVSAMFLLVFPTAIFPQQNPAGESDLVHFGDIIDVDVLGSTEFDWRGKLNPEGFLDGLNTYSEPVYGLCRSEIDIGTAAAAAFSKLLRDPKVVVRIVDKTNRAVAVVDGAVRNPQRFQLRRSIDLRELLVLSGGISDDSSGEIQLFRPPNLDCTAFNVAVPSDKGKKAIDLKSNETSITTIKISDLLKGTAGANPSIRSGDMITVLRSVPIYVIGGVNDPKPLMSRPGLTLSRVIAMAGGTSKEAERGMVTVYRRRALDPLVIEADLNKISAGTEKDPELMPYDIVEVAQKNSAKRRYAPVVQLAQTPRPTVLPLRIVE